MRVRKEQGAEATHTMNPLQNTHATHAHLPVHIEACDSDGACRSLHRLSRTCQLVQPLALLNMSLTSICRQGKARVFLR